MGASRVERAVCSSAEACFSREISGNAFAMGLSRDGVNFYDYRGLGAI